MGWEVEHVHTKTGKFILGLRLRTDGDDGIPTHEFTLIQRVTDGDGSGDGLGDGSEGLPNKDFEQGDGLTPTSSEKIINEIEQLQVKKEASDVKTETDYSMEVTDKPSPPLKNSPGKGFEPSPHPSPNPSPDEGLVGWNERHAKKPYPNPKSNNVLSSQKRALAIRDAYRAARCQADLTSLRNDKGGEFSKQELAWVRNWLGQYFRTESNHLEATTKVIQGNLLE
jgi:hypothetical protein